MVDFECAVLPPKLQIVSPVPPLAVMWKSVLLHMPHITFCTDSSKQIVTGGMPAPPWRSELRLICHSPGLSLGYCWAAAGTDASASMTRARVKRDFMEAPGYGVI